MRYVMIFGAGYYFGAFINDDSHDYSFLGQMVILIAVGILIPKPEKVK